MDVDIGIHMSLFDFLIVGFLGFGFFRGYQQSFIVQVIALFALLVGTVAAYKVASFLFGKTDESSVNTMLITFAILFIPVLFGSHYIAIYIKNMVNNVPNTLKHKIIGGIAATIKYLVIISTFLIFLNRMDNNFGIIHTNELHRTKLYKQVLKITPAIIPGLKPYSKIREQAPPLEEIPFVDE